MEAVARLRNCPTSPRKMRLVADTIRGMNVDKALYALQYSQKQEASGRLGKLLDSAIHNWEAKNEGARVEDSNLYVKSVFVDSGRVLKRFRPAPQGRANRIRKRSNHVTIVIDSRTAEAAPAKETAKAKAAAKPAKETATTKKAAAPKKAAADKKPAAKKATTKKAAPKTKKEDK